MSSAAAASRRPVGHASAIQQLSRAHRRGRLGGAYLFVGPAGVGKRVVADRIAAALLCHRADARTLSPCGACDSCRLVEGGAHPDLLVVERPEGKSAIPIGLLLGAGEERNRVGLCHDLALRPMVSDRRVAILDDADSLGIEGANCLLKTLEEPPPRSVLILIGTSLAKQLPTIRSRTQVIRFGALSPEEILEVLRGQGADPPGEGEARIAAESRGSVARALALGDPTLRSATDAVVACLASPRVEAARLAAVLEDESKAAGKEPSARRERLADLLDAATSFYRSRLRGLSADGATVESLEAALGALEICLNASEALSRNANQSALAQRLAVELSRVA